MGLKSSLHLANKACHPAWDWVRPEEGPSFALEECLSVICTAAMHTAALHTTPPSKGQFIKTKACWLKEFENLKHGETEAHEGEIPKVMLLVLGHSTDFRSALSPAVIFVLH